MNDTLLILKDELYLNGIKLCDCINPGILTTGLYNLEINYSPKFKTDLPLIYNDHFPASRGFRIHQGNTLKDTQGCILVGKLNKNGILIDSLKTLDYVKYIIKTNNITRCLLYI